MLLGDTIAAIATAPGRGGVAVIRVSGPDAFEIAKRLTGRVSQPGRIACTKLCAPTQSLGQGLAESPEVAPTRGRGQSLPARVAAVLDEAVVLAFRAPHSYTGEDVVEFQCHGGTVTPRRVLEACFAAGARLARRGEFTQRAFLNGRLDYDQAESVLDLIDAKTARAADAALEGLAGRKRRECRALYEEALAISADLEHALDIDEGELPDDFLPTALSRVSRLTSDLNAVIRRAREGRLLREGALVVLAGPPNAGKSSLMNALLEENRAIVSDIPGTTRDSIEEWLNLDGWPVRLVDTAGLRDAGDQIEAEGVKRAEELIARADVVLALVPAGQVPARSLGQGLAEPPEDAPTRGHGQSLPVQELPSTAIPVTSKCDLGRGEGLNVSAKTGEGLNDLKQAIVARLESRTASGDETSSYDDDRLATLLDVSAQLSSLIPHPFSSDLVLLANAVRAAAERLGSVIGATYSSDLLDSLFSRFCVGK